MIDPAIARLALDADPGVCLSIWPAIFVRRSNSCKRLAMRRMAESRSVALGSSPVVLCGRFGPGMWPGICASGCGARRDCEREREGVVLRVPVVAVETELEGWIAGGAVVTGPFGAG